MSFWPLKMPFILAYLWLNDPLVILLLDVENHSFYLGERDLELLLKNVSDVKISPVVDNHYLRPDPSILLVISLSHLQLLSLFNSLLFCLLVLCLKLFLFNFSWLDTAHVNGSEEDNDENDLGANCEECCHQNYYSHVYRVSQWEQDD